MSRVVDSRLGYFILFTFTVLLYANTIFSDFVLDDEVAILKNTYVQRGLAGIKDILTHDSFTGYGRIGEGESLLTGGRYRPLSLVVFAVLQANFGNNPLPFHLLNILIYGLGGMLLFYFLKQLLHQADYGNHMAFVVSLVFIAHPVHTEVVANIKSLDELLVLLFGISALIGLLRAYDTKSVFWMIVSSLAMLFACFAKENAVLLMLVGPLMLWFFRRTGVSRQWKYYLPMLMGAVFFLYTRYLVLGNLPEGRVMLDPLNNPFLEWAGNTWIACSGSTRFATIAYTLGRYLGLMIFPYPLTHDYYPFHIELQSILNAKVILSMFSIAGLVWLGLWGLIKKRNWSFGIWFFVITGSLTTNIFFPVGVFMAERFLFLPSLGLMLAFVLWLYPRVVIRYKKAGMFCLGFGIVLFSILTIHRNQAWKDNETLMRADIQTSSNSARLRHHLGTFLLDEALQVQDQDGRQRFLEEARPHLEMAVELHPNYFDALLASGACHYYLEDYQRAVQNYRTALAYYAGSDQATQGLWYALLALGKDQWEKGDSTQAIQTLTEAWNVNQDADNAFQIAAYYFEIRELEKSMEWESKARALK